MKSPAEKTSPEKNPSTLNEAPSLQPGGALQAKVVDKRSAALTQRRMQKLADKRPASKPIVQRVIDIPGDRVYGEGDAETLKANYKNKTTYNEKRQEWQDIFAAVQETDDAPRTLEDAVKDERRFAMTRVENKFGVFWSADVAPQEKALQGGGKSREAGAKPVRIQRPAQDVEELVISGLIMCIGVVIEARDKDEKIVAAAGGHFVTPDCMAKKKPEGKDDSKGEPTYSLTGDGTGFLQSIVGLVQNDGKLSAVLMTVGVSIGSNKSGAQEDAEKAVELIAKALAMPCTVSIGDSKRLYHLNASGASKY